jgi:hypothetical protein
MEFDAEVTGEYYRFTSINSNSFLVSGRKGEYILYKNKIWRCADELPMHTLEKLGEIIDEHIHVRSQVKKF